MWGNKDILDQMQGFPTCWEFALGGRKKTVSLPVPSICRDVRDVPAGGVLSRTVSFMANGLGLAEPARPEEVHLTGKPYYPDRSDWEQIDPGHAGLDPDGLAQVVAFAEANESPWSRTMYLPDGRYIGTADMDEGAPWDTVLGPVRPRGKANGLVIRHGRIAAEWGDTERADMTFSIAKSYLAILAGEAVARGLIGSLDDPVRNYCKDGGFESPQNSPITWRHLLQQTSEWEGTLFKKHDMADRNRHVGPGVGAKPKGSYRELRKSGTYWEYNDVRINRLSLSLLQVFRRPLPDILRGAVMDPIGASSSWEWNGYRTSDVEIDGKVVNSVSGGGHWGGGMVVSSRDHARVGYLIQRGGDWQGHQLVRKSWITEMTTPCGLKPIYGLLWWLNTARAFYPAAPASSFFAVGMGTNLIWIDPSLDLVVVARWIAKDRVNDLVAKVMGAFV